MRVYCGPRNGSPWPQFDGEQYTGAPARGKSINGANHGSRGSPRFSEFAHADDQGDLTMHFDKELDARGLSCPLPILKTKKALNDLASGQVLKVVATDPGSVKDMQAFANQTGNPLLSTAEEAKDFVFFLKKK
jgi:tRNA 2-thiouridine synthesizing protein A